MIGGQILGHTKNHLYLLLESSKLHNGHLFLYDHGPHVRKGAASYPIAGIGVSNALLLHTTSQVPTIVPMWPPDGDPRRKRTPNTLGHHIFVTTAPLERLQSSTNSTVEKRCIPCRRSASMWRRCSTRTSSLQHGISVPN